MKSMTGYGYSEYQDEKIHIIIELKSFNNRYLDINLKLPPYLNRLEPKIREFISSHVKRGRIEIYLKAVELEEDLSYILDTRAVKSSIKILKELEEIAKENGIDDSAGLSNLLKMDGIVKSEKNFNLDKFSELFYPLLEEVFNSFENMRISEGKATEKDIGIKIESIKKNMSLISDNASKLEEKLKSDLLGRIETLEKSMVDETRIYSEIAILLMKYSINEEIERIKTHIESFENVMTEESSSGKKLDFICQELNREINTIGSKSTIIEVNQSVIEIKDAIENIREQIRNVE